MKKAKSKLLSLSIVLMFTMTTLMFNPNVVKASNLDKNEQLEEQRELYKEGMLETKKDLDEIVRVIVQLKEEPVVKNKNKNVTEHYIIKSQEAIKVKAMALKGANLRHSYGYLINGFSMDVKRSEIAKIEKIYGVENVREVKIYEPCMTTAKELTQVYKTWENLKIKGEGMVVSVIDSGIDVNHKDMRLSDETKVALNQTLVSKVITNNGLKGKYFTAKIPYAYNYADDSVDPKDTKDDESHGMHVAGIVGANGKAEDVAKTEAIQGVAPECQIVAMKVFSNNPNKKGASSDDIVKAIEDAAKLKVDVINMSLGGTAGFQDDADAEQIAIKNATETGVVVVVSAGNSYYSTYPKRIPGLVDIGLVGAPGIAKDALQVASYENTNITAVGFDYASSAGNGVVVYSQGEEADPLQIFKDSNGYELVDCGQGNKAEDYNSAELKGKIALIEKVGGTYGDRKFEAQKAGAIGAIIYGAEGNEGLPNTALRKDVTIPSVCIGHVSGVTLKNLISKGVRVKFNGKVVIQENGDRGDMSDFSSWGPAPNLEFKPQITGIGGNIRSTLNDNSYGLMSGTSMSSPHVAGGEALILQGIKENKKVLLTGRELVEFAKATSINTSIPMMDKHHEGVPYSPRRQGSGLIQIKDAINNSVIVTGEDGKPTLALKEMGKEKSFGVILKNYSDKDITYNVKSISGVLTEDNKKLDTTGSTTLPYDIKIQEASLTYENDGKYVLVDGNSSVRVPAKGTTHLTFKVVLPDNFATEQFVEGFVRFESIDKETIPSVGIPFMGFYGNWSKPTVIDAPAWMGEASVTKKSFLIQSDTDGLYISGNTGTKDLLGNYIIDKERIVISPNGDGQCDNVIPNLFFFRNVKIIGGEIQNSAGQIVRHFEDSKPVRKGEGLEGEDSKASRLFNLKWDGKLDDGTIAPDGEYKLVVKSTVDIEGAQPQPYYLPVKIDGTVPKLQIVSSKNAEGKKYILKFKAQDALVGLSKVAVSLNGEKIDKTLISKVDNVYSCELQLKDGYNKINVSAYDFGLNKNIEELIIKFGNVPQDKQAPTIDLVSKVGSTINDYTFVCDVKDDASGVGTVSIEFNGEKIDSSLVNKVGSIYSSKLKLKNGKNIIKVTAEDNEKNPVGKEFNIEVKEDKEGPILELLSPSSSPTNKYKLKFKMVDEISDLDYYLVSLNNQYINPDIKKDGDIYSCDLELLNGDNAIKITVYDKFKNNTRKIFSVKVGDVSKDNVAPKIELTSLSVTNVSKYKFTTKITDDFSGVANVSMWLNGVKVSDTKISKSEDEYSSELELKEGENKIKVVATDIAKNEATKEISIKYDKNVTIEDKEEPVVQLISSKNSNTSKYKMQCKVTDASGIDYVAYKFNGIRKSNEDITINGDIYSCELDLFQGNNTIQVIAKDNKGNYNFSDFVVKYEAGVPTTPELSIKLKESNIANGEAKISFEAINTTEKSEKLTLILALYDKQNKFISYKIKSIEVGKNQQILLNNSIQIAPNATRLKCFVWDSLEGMKPFIGVTEIAIPKK